MAVTNSGKYKLEFTGTGFEKGMKVNLKTGDRELSPYAFVKSDTEFSIRFPKSSAVDAFIQVSLTKNVGTTTTTSNTFSAILSTSSPTPPPSFQVGEHVATLKIDDEAGSATVVEAAIPAFRWPLSLPIVCRPLA